MKKMVLGLSLALATLCFFVSPAMAADPPQGLQTVSAADQAFLASLTEQAGTPDPVPAARRPGRPEGIGEKALCTATAHCWNGTTVTCQDNTVPASCTAVDSNCPGQRGSVTCNGITTLCPACPCNLNCNQEKAECLDYCDPCPISFSCNLTTCTSTCTCRYSTTCN